MTLSALIRKRDTGNLATAIPAISATQPKREAATVARIARVAVANPKEEKTAPPAKVSPGDTTPMTAEAETAIRAWLALIEETDPAARSQRFVDTVRLICCGGARATGLALTILIGDLGVNAGRN